MLTPARAKECVSERPNIPFRIPWSDLVAMRVPQRQLQNSGTVDLRHTLVHEGEEADGRCGDAHGVDESTREVRAEDGAEIVFGYLFSTVSTITRRLYSKKHSPVP